MRGIAAGAAVLSNGGMRVAFAHHEPIDPGRARWVAMVRSVAAMAEQTPVTWYTPDPAARVAEFAQSHLGLNLPEALTIKTLPSIHKRFGLTLNAVFFRAFRRAIEAGKPDILWLRSDKLAAYAAHKSLPAPLVYEAHLIGELWAADKQGTSGRAARLAQLERDIYAKAAGVAAITQGLLDEIRARFAYAGPAAVTPSAVDTDVFKPVWRRGADDTVVWVGTLQFWKGVDLLLDALALTPGLRLKLVGGGKPEAERQLADEIARRGLSGRVEMTGRVAQTEIPAHVRGALCAVHPLPPEHSISARFTSPLKLFEYMALGVPIVASDVPSVREVLADGVNARLFEAGNANALAEALRGIAAVGEALSRQAVQDAERYTYRCRASALLELFAKANPLAE